MALLCCPVFSSSTLPPASLNPPTEFHLPEACWGAAGVTALGLAKVRLFGGCSPTFIRDNCKALSDFRETGILYNIPENLNCCKIYPSTWQGRGVHAQREAEHIEEDDVREQKGPAVPQGIGSQVQWQQDRDPSWEGQAGQAQRLQQVQSRAPALREAHEDEADPRSRWKWIDWSAWGLMTAVRDKHSSGSTRHVHRDRTCPQPSREAHLQVWVQMNRDHRQAKTAELQTRAPPEKLWEKQESRLRLKGSHELMGREGGEAPPEDTQDH